MRSKIGRVVVHLEERISTIALSYKKSLWSS